MTTPPAKVTSGVVEEQHGLFRATWVLTAAAPEGEPLVVGHWRERSVQVEGTFGPADVQFYGSNSGQAYAPIGAAAYEDIVTLPPVAIVKPRLVNPDATTAVTVTVVGRRP